MKLFSLISLLAVGIGANPLTTSYTTSQSYGSSVVDDGSGHPKGQAWGNQYGSSSITNPQGYTFTNTGGNNYHSPLNGQQIGQLVQNNLAQSANIRAALYGGIPQILYPVPPTTY
jgi:hypothetical protein